MVHISPKDCLKAISSYVEKLNLFKNEHMAKNEIVTNLIPGNDEIIQTE